MRCGISFAVLLMSISADVRSGEPLAALGAPVAVPHPRGIGPVANGVGYNRVPAPAPTGRTSVHFSGPAGLMVAWQSAGGAFDGELTAPKEYNFRQGHAYRLRLKAAGDTNRAFYPTLEVAPASAGSRVFLAHASVPVAFSSDDFARAADGESVVKVVYLPDPARQDFGTVIGAEEVVSYRLEPGTDPVEEARRRGTVLAIVRLGRVEMEKPRTPGR